MGLGYKTFKYLLYFISYLIGLFIFFVSKKTILSYLKLEYKRFAFKLNLCKSILFTFRYFKVLLLLKSKEIELLLLTVLILFTYDNSEF